MSRSTLIPLIVCLLLLTSAAESATLIVPDNYTSIESALLDAADGDTILVKPGTYPERIDFFGKAVTLRSTDGAAVTIIDAGRAGSVVTFCTGEGAGSVIEGFTLTNGSAPRGGGVYCGAGVTARIVSNRIVANEASGTYGKGGGLFCYEAAAPVMANNLIAANSAYCGGGIYCKYAASPVLTNNTIVENTAAFGGGGIYCRQSAPIVYNTILHGNEGPKGPEVILAHAASLSISDSLVEGLQGGIHVYTGSTLDWGSGMIDGDPLFVDPDQGDFHITWKSPCRNAGDLFAPEVAVADFEGQPRISEEAVDIGADEYYIEDGGPYPFVDIKCNGQDRDVVLSQADKVTVTIEVKSHDYSGFPAEVWMMIVDENNVPASYQNGRWWLGWCHPYHSGGLTDLSDTVTDGFLDPGTYRGWLAVDLTPNGQFNRPKLWYYDWCTLTVTP